MRKLDSKRTESAKKKDRAIKQARRDKRVMQGR
jgi:hypothetical protein